VPASGCIAPREVGRNLAGLERNEQRGHEGSTRRCLLQQAEAVWWWSREWVLRYFYMGERRDGESPDNNAALWRHLTKGGEKHDELRLPDSSRCRCRWCCCCAVSCGRRRQLCTSQDGLVVEEESRTGAASGKPSHVRGCVRKTWTVRATTRDKIAESVGAAVRWGVLGGEGTCLSYHTGP
jgi:hypothetical protein